MQSERKRLPDDVSYRLADGLVVIDGEDAAAFAALRLHLDNAFQPHGPVATFLVDYAATLMWRLRRVATFEAGILSWIADQQSRRHDGKGIALGDVFFATDPRALAKPSRAAGDHRLNRRGRQVVGRALEVALDAPDPLGKIGRYEGHLMRQLVRTLELLRQAGLTNADRSGANKLPAQT
jgi:hypothetical protein